MNEDEQAAQPAFRFVQLSPFPTAGIPPTVSINVNTVDVDPATPGVQVIEGSTIDIAPTVGDDVQRVRVDAVDAAKQRCVLSGGRHDRSRQIERQPFGVGGRPSQPPPTACASQE